MAGRPTERLADQTRLGEAWLNASVAVVMFDEQRNFVAANDEYCRLTGYSREEIKQLRVGTDLAADNASRGIYATIVRGGRPKGAGRLRRKDGSTLMVKYRVVTTTV